MSDEKKDQAPRQFDENQGLPPTKLKEGSFMKRVRKILWVTLR